MGPGSGPRGQKVGGLVSREENARRPCAEKEMETPRARKRCDISGRLSGRGGARAGQSAGAACGLLWAGRRRVGGVKGRGGQWRSGSRPVAAPRTAVGLGREARTVDDWGEGASLGGLEASGRFFHTREAERSGTPSPAGAAVGRAARWSCPPFPSPVFGISRTPR